MNYKKICVGGFDGMGSRFFYATKNVSSGCNLNKLPIWTKYFSNNKINVCSFVESKYTLINKYIEHKPLKELL